MTECDEVASAIVRSWLPLATAAGVPTYDDAIAVVRARMPDESETVISNTAWSLWQTVQRESLKAYLVKTSGLIEPYKQAPCGCCAGPEGHYELGADHCTCPMHQDVPRGRPAKVCSHHKGVR